MKAALVFGVLLLAVLAVSSTKEVDVDRGKLIALENAWNQAQVHHDAKAVGQLLPDSFVYTDYDGTVMNKAKFLADVKDEKYKATSITNEDLQIFPYQNAAIVIGTYRSKGMYAGKPFDHRGRFTDTWIYQNGQWLCAATHTNLITK
jgi:ketosteroid isomerase-like protein